MSTMNEVVRQLSSLLEEWGPSGNGPIQEIELGKIRTFEFQENLQKRALIQKGLEGKACVLCGHFDEHVSHEIFYFQLPR